MAIDQESFNKRLYDLLKTHGYNPVAKNSKNEKLPVPQEADIFEFNFTKDGTDYGKVWATINKAKNLEIYYSDEVASSPPGKTPGKDYDDSWHGLIKQLKQWAGRKLLSFELKDMSNLNDDMTQRKWHDMKEVTNEGYHAVNKTTSYNDNIPNVKVVIQHDRQIGEGEQRWRNVHKIFVENTEGERFAVPTRMPGIARVYGRHVAEGGTPYDERGKHITTLVEEYTKMAGFVRATRRGEFNESVAKLISEGVNHHKALRESLQKMRSHRGYTSYFESWTPPLMEDDSDSSSIAEMFAQGTIDPRIESVLPILNRLNSSIINEIEEVNELDQWAKGITEITEEVVEEGVHKEQMIKDSETMSKEDFIKKYGKEHADDLYDDDLYEEKRDTHCSAKCCGADVKAEDCGCSPDCPHCNCNAKLEENISGNKPDTIDSEMDAYFGSKPGELEEEKGKIKDKHLDENPLLGIAARAVVGSAIKGALSSDEEELDEEDIYDTEQLSNIEKEKLTQDGISRATQIIDRINQNTNTMPRRVEMVKLEQAKIREQQNSLADIPGEATLDAIRKFRILSAMSIRFNEYIGNPSKRTSVDANAVDAAIHQMEKELNKDQTTRTPFKKSSLTLPGMIAKGMELANPYDKPRQPNITPKDMKVGESKKDNKGFTDKEIKMAYGIANDKRYKDGNMTGAINAIEKIAKGLSDHPSVEKVLQATQMEETKSGGMTFAGNYKTGKAGQWRNTGPTKGRPAKVGDLVGAESAEPKMAMLEDEMYDVLSDGDIVRLRNDDEYTISHNSDGTISAVADDVVIPFAQIKDQIVDYGDPSDRKDHRPDNMPTEDVYEADNSALAKRAMERFKGIDKTMAQKIANAVKPKGTINSKLYVELGDLYDKKDMKGVDALLKEAENSPDGNVGADDDGNNDKYNVKSIQEGDELLDIIKSIKF